MQSIVVSCVHFATHRSCHTHILGYTSIEQAFGILRRVLQIREQSV